MVERARSAAAAFAPMYAAGGRAGVVLNKKPVKTLKGDARGKASRRKPTWRQLILVDYFVAEVHLHFFAQPCAAQRSNQRRFVDVGKVLRLRVLSTHRPPLSILEALFSFPRFQSPSYPRLSNGRLGRGARRRLASAYYVVELAGNGISRKDSRRRSIASEHNRCRDCVKGTRGHHAYRAFVSQ